MQFIVGLLFWVHEIVKWLYLYEPSSPTFLTRLQRELPAPGTGAIAPPSPPALKLQPTPLSPPSPTAPTGPGEYNDDGNNEDDVYEEFDVSYDDDTGPDQLRIKDNNGHLFVLDYGDYLDGQPPASATPPVKKNLYKHILTPEDNSFSKSPYVVDLTKKISYQQQQQQQHRQEHKQQQRPQRQQQQQQQRQQQQQKIAQ